MTSSTIWVSVISVLRTEGICPYPTTATSIIRSPSPASALTSTSGSPVGIQPSMPPSVLLQPPAARSSRLRSASGRHTAATRMPTRTSLTGVSSTSWSCSMPPGPSSAIDTRAKGSVSSWPGYCHRRDDGEVDDGAGVAELDVVVGGELDHVDGAEVLGRHVDQAAVAGAPLPDDLAVEQRLGVAGDRGRGRHS